jgi:hypothetical protein
MAADERPGTDGVPPPGELIHLPGPSYLPVLLAFGITLSVIGVVIWLPVTVIGVITTVTILVLWIREARAEMAELPLEHH